MTYFPLYPYDSDPLRILSPRNDYRPVPRHPCSIGGVHEQAEPSPPAPREVEAPPPEPPEPPAPAETGTAQLAPEAVRAAGSPGGPDRPSAGTGAQPEPVLPEPELDEQVAAWLSAHWDTLSAMAQAGEAPMRPIPPGDGEVAAHGADEGGSRSGAASAASPFHDAAQGPPPGEDLPPPPYVAPGDRWTKWKMAEFLRHLAASQSVTAAAKAVGMSRNSAYKLRNRLKGQPFDIAWEAAFRHGYDNLAHSALELALEGEEVPHYHKGELVGTHRKRNPALIVQLLRMRNREGAPMLGRYGAAAEYWSEEWDRMTRRIETGAVSWSEELAALAPEDREDLPSARMEIDGFIRRNLPDEGPKGRARA